MGIVNLPPAPHGGGKYSGSVELSRNEAEVMLERLSSALSQLQAGSSLNEVSRATLQAPGPPGRPAQPQPQQQQQQQQYKQMTYQGQQGQMMQPRMTMQGGYSSPSGGNPSTSMPRNQQGGDMYQQRPSFNQGSVMELLLNMGQRAVGLAVEIHSQSSQHSRKGVVRMVVPQQLCIVVQFGGVSTPLKASDEFREFTIRILQDNSGR
uniref:Uncharacterized protein n=1 Tax=Tetraselmis chuii TaxID=63592 RepID=A0A7S1X1N8_9CHLO|mmetsp:Transcript_19317/g.34443  ORF Transcript_19317/g.34443 Transcript_19317/m.34443 type:complete len:207 (+) Transcript_19317:148-768(+)